jgi:hypothetical protein
MAAEFLAALQAWLGPNALKILFSAYIVLGAFLTMRVLRRAGFTRFWAFPPWTPFVFALAPGWEIWAALGVPIVLILAWRFAHSRWPRTAFAADGSGRPPPRYEHGYSAATGYRSHVLPLNGIEPTWLMSGFDRYGRVVRIEIPERALLLAEQGLVLGRHPDMADILIRDDSLSRRHCRIWLADDRLWLEDLGSRNGTRVDGRRLSAHRPVQVSPGAAVDAGGVQITIARSI